MRCTNSPGLDGSAGIEKSKPHAHICIVIKYAILSSSFRSKEPILRGPHAKPNQRAYIINYMYAHPCFAHGRFNGPLGANRLKTQWKRLAAQVNNIEGGSVKTVEQWLRVRIRFIHK